VEETTQKLHRQSLLASAHQRVPAASEEASEAVSATAVEGSEDAVEGSEAASVIVAVEVVMVEEGVLATAVLLMRRRVRGQVADTAVIEVGMEVEGEEAGMVGTMTVAHEMLTTSRYLREAVEVGTVIGTLVDSMVGRRGRTRVVGMMTRGRGEGTEWMCPYISGTQTWRW